MAKQTGDSESDLPQKRVRIKDAGHSEAPSFAKRRLQLQQVSPRRVHAANKEFSIEASHEDQCCGVKTDKKGSQRRHLSPYIYGKQESKTHVNMKSSSNNYLYCHPRYCYPRCT